LPFLFFGFNLPILLIFTALEYKAIPVVAAPTAIPITPIVTLAQFGNFQ